MSRIRRILLTAACLLAIVLAGVGCAASLPATSLPPTAVSSSVATPTALPLAPSVAPTAVVGLEPTPSRSPATPVPAAAPTAVPTAARATPFPTMPPRAPDTYGFGGAPQETLSPVARVQGPSQVGDTRRFSVLDLATSGYTEIEASLRHISERAQMWVQTGLRASDAGLAASARAFDERIYPAVAGMTGSPVLPPDAGTPYIVLNMPITGAAGYYAAHADAAAGEGTGEAISGVFVMNVAALQPGTDRYDSVLTHELQHAFLARIDPNEVAWVSEGASQLAETLAGYPVPQSAVTAFAREPDIQVNTWSSAPGAVMRHYGASYLLMRYFYERYGEQGLQALLTHPADGVAAFDAVLAELDGSHFDALYADWALANLLDDPAILDFGSGYAGVDLALVPQRRLSAYPSVTTGDLAPYGTQYVEILADDVTLPGAWQIRLESAPTTRIVPADVPSGDSMWWSNRGDAGHSWLERTLDLSAVSQAELTFDLWFDIEAGWDYARVRVSEDDGETWTWLEGRHTLQASESSAMSGPVYTGRSGAPSAGSTSRDAAQAQWVQEAIDLTPFAGQEIILRLDMLTDDAQNEPGLCVDNLAVEAIGWRDEDGEDTGWTAAGFLRTDNLLPVTYAVHVVVYGEDDVTVLSLEMQAGQGQWLVPMPASTPRRMILVLSGMAPVSTEAIPYTLYVDEVLAP